MSLTVPLHCAPNPYGYRYNVNHPIVNDLYRRYVKWKGIARPLTDAERFEFEKYLDRVFAGKKE